MLTSIRKGILLLACGLAALAPAASAQDDPVFVDPDSPSGKEYELPIDRAREQGAAGRQRQQPAGGAQGAPLFGAGVEGDDRNTSPGTAKSGTRSDGNGGGGSDDAASEPGSEQATVGAAAARKVQAATPDGSTGVLEILGAGGGILLLGGLAGLLLRRRAAG